MEESFPMIHSSKPPIIHFVGIGGTGMNGVAQLAKCAGFAVSGSDRTENPERFEILKNLGIGIFPQDGSGITKKTDLVVFSTAIESNNPDIQKSKSLNIPLLHRAEILATLCEGKEVIAVAGTAGKSTVTGLLGHIFQTLEKDPTVYCGASVLNWKNNVAAFAGVKARVLPPGTEAGSPCHSVGNIRFGKSNLWIIEADESDKSFLNFHPDHAIITNIAEDHFELSELRRLFAQFESQVSGTVITPDPPHRPGTPPWRGFISSSDSPPTEGWPKDGVDSLLIGKHNTENIHNALRLCQALGLDMKKCIAAVSTFKGIERRLERIGDRVIDDFAHSPVKIAAALEAVSEVWSAFNVVWRPHGYTPLFQGLEGFIDVFSNVWKNRAGKLYILPVYYAGGTVEKKITSEQFVERLRTVGVYAEFQPLENNTRGGTLSAEAPAKDEASFQILEKRLIEDGLPVLVMGARDQELPKFARRVAAKLDRVQP